MYKAVTNSVLLYGSASWVVMGAMLNFLEGFHHRAAWQITVMLETHGAGGEWEYPLVVAALEAAVIHPIMEYIRRRQAAIAEKVACRPIYELCVEAEQRPGMTQRMRWWDQEVVNEPEDYMDNLCNLT